MSTTAMVSIVGPDRVGLISAISGLLFDLGADLGDTTFSVLGGEAEFSAICDFPDGLDIENLRAELASLEETANCDITVEHFDQASTHPAWETITHLITVSGGDSPGLMARLCEVFQQFDANIVRLNSERVPGGDHTTYVISASVSIPEAAENSCMATVANTAGELGLTCNWSKTRD